MDQGFVTGGGTGIPGGTCTPPAPPPTPPLVPPPPGTENREGIPRKGNGGIVAPAPKNWGFNVGPKRCISEGIPGGENSEVAGRGAVEPNSGEVGNCGVFGLPCRELRQLTGGTSTFDLSTNFDASEDRRNWVGSDERSEEVAWCKRGKRSLFPSPGRPLTLLLPGLE